eukprot:2078696-Alexandrium_andersonii.AAC.1
MATSAALAVALRFRLSWRSRRGLRVDVCAPGDSEGHATSRPTVKSFTYLEQGCPGNNKHCNSTSGATVENDPAVHDSSRRGPKR